MPIRRRSALTVPIILLVTIVARTLTAADELKSKETEVKPNADRRPNVTISKETTYITEPLRPDGYVDYIAAINR